jgi:hypothetical protein
MSTNGISKHSYTAVNQSLPLPPAPPRTIKQVPVTHGGAPWSETVLVTPQIAEHWLESNVLNRQVRKSRVRTYARDMAAGKWQFNTQGITFATDGTLIDGQHRLKAVVESGASVLMVVWFNVPPTTRDVIDLVGPRNLSDIGNLTKLQAAVSMAMMRGLGGHGTTITMTERVSFFRRFASEIDGVISRFSTFRRGITQANVLAAIARASLHLSREDVEQFCDVLQTGMPSSNPRDATVIRLRDRLLQASHPGGTTAAKEIYGVTSSALRAFGEGRSISKLYPVSADPFPLPDRSGE